MAKSAYIKLVEGSSLQGVSLNQVKEKLGLFIEKTTRTGKQLGWDYASAAFPYSVEERTSEGEKWLLLKGREPRLYKYLLIKVDPGQEKENASPSCIQVVLPEEATHGDTAKANEYSRYLAQSFQGELHLFNGRVMYFNPRKP